MEEALYKLLSTWRLTKTKAMQKKTTTSLRTYEIEKVTALAHRTILEHRSIISLWIHKTQNLAL